MMRQNIVYPLNSFKSYKYTVILSFYQGKILLSQHKQRSTWETQGGHIEVFETPLACAHRELREESGARDYQLEAVFDYCVEDRAGVVYVANIETFDALPNLEMKAVQCFDVLPQNLSYPHITPQLFNAWFEKISKIRE